MTETRQKTLKDISIFAGMDDADMEAVARVLRRLAVRPGETLFRRGERARTMFAIVQGSVDIIDPMPDGRNVHLATLDAGAVMGEVALLDGGIRAAAAIAREPTICVTLDAAGLERLLQERPDAARKLMMTLADNLAKRLRQAKILTNQIAEAQTRKGAKDPSAADTLKALWRRMVGR
jgi:CRP-like cAMP-binding protein